MNLWLNIWKVIFLGLVICACVTQPEPPQPTESPVIIPSPTQTTGPCSSEDMVDFEAEKFCIDKNEVTNGQYQECVADKKCTEPKETTNDNNEPYYGETIYDNYPVVNVTWEQAEQYCGFKSKRLPSATEWDRAANYYTWPLNDEITKYEDTQKVGKIQDVSNEGVHDLAGNVREWVANDHPENITDHKLVKGYDFLSTDDKTTSYHKTDYHDPYLGFRCAADSK